jgi:restriction system protein
MDLLILILSILIGTFIFFRIRGANKQRLAAEKLHELIEPHVVTLALRRRQLAYRDPYGDLILDKWRKEQKQFVLRKIAPAVSGKLRVGFDTMNDITAMIDLKIEAYENQQPPASSISFETTDPRKFEEAVADALRGFGWEARTTQASGDQGVDVVAIRGCKKVVVQCKLYSRPVSNKAVQEAHAAMAFEKADVGIVVTNASFTASARILAESTGVLLLHPDELGSLGDLLIGRVPVRGVASDH